jgi:anti-sigma factor RsiW
MRLIRPSHTVCDEAREWISLALDGELSELGRARLHAHLEGCPSCRAFEAEGLAVTGALRAATLEEPAFEVAVPGTRRVPVRLLQASAAAAAVAVLVTGSLVNGFGQRQAARQPSRLVPKLSFASLDGSVPVRQPVAQLQPKAKFHAV